MNADLPSPTPWPATSSITTSGRAQRLAAPLLISGLVIAGPPVGTTDIVQTRLVEQSPITDRTTAGGVLPVSARRTPETAHAVRELHDRSGLTWEELARLFGVSRRAVHKWAEGGRLNSHHMELLGKLHAIVNDIDTGESDSTRAALMTVRDGQAPLYVTLLRRLQADHRAVGPEPADLLASRWDVNVPVGEVVTGRQLPKPPGQH